MEGASYLLTRIRGEVDPTATAARSPQRGGWGRHAESGGQISRKDKNHERKNGTGQGGASYLLIWGGLGRWEATGTAAALSTSKNQ